MIFQAYYLLSVMEFFEIRKIGKYLSDILCYAWIGEMGFRIFEIEPLVYFRQET